MPPSSSINHTDRCDQNIERILNTQVVRIAKKYPKVVVAHHVEMRFASVPTAKAIGTDGQMNDQPSPLKGSTGEVSLT
jgi:hypothetical protein